MHYSRSFVARCEDSKVGYETDTLDERRKGTEEVAIM